MQKSDLPSGYKWTWGPDERWSASHRTYQMFLSKDRGREVSTDLEQYFSNSFAWGVKGHITLAHIDTVYAKMCVYMGMYLKINSNK